MKKESLVEELLMEIQATAMRGLEGTGTCDQQLRGMFSRIVEAACYTQSINQGLRTARHEVNGNLLRLLGHENLN